MCGTHKRIFIDYNTQSRLQLIIPQSVIIAYKPHNYAKLHNIYVRVHTL